MTKQELIEQIRENCKECTSRGACIGILDYAAEDKIELQEYNCRCRKQWEDE